MNLQTDLLRTKSYLDKLATGIDPITNLTFPNDTILNNKQLSSFFHETSNLIKEILIKNGGEVQKTSVKRKFPFYITSEQCNEIELSERPIAISKLTYSINAVTNNTNTKKLRATDITSWLLNRGYLKMIYKHDNGFKTPTDKGKDIGITSTTRINNYDEEYIVNEYSIEAQKYIIANLNAISGINMDDIDIIKKL
ncbi:MAG: hypothetical protein K0S41_1248 [Anaerocolumna sp.]|nr:hypothetical protein [Anaerocolumna sp.]